MRIAPLIAMGVTLTALGAVALSWEKISYTTRETVVDVGVVKVKANNKEDLLLSPILGGMRAHE
jgi:hypothetical protein